MLAGNGIMVNWSNWGGLTRDGQQAWRRWHTAEHMVGRLRVPGFLRGRRYGAVEANRSKMTFYELDSPGVLASEAYRNLANEPFGESRGGGSTADAVRNIATVRHTLGPAVGGHALTLRLDVPAEHEARFAGHLVSEALPAVAAEDEIVGAHLCVSDAEASAIVPVSLEGRVTVGPRWIVMVEGMTQDAVKAAFARHLSTLGRYGAAGPIEPNTYQLEVVMTR